ncbi:DUF4190 domain-containing protein [Mycobacterium sp. 1274761.0]|uniref:DUF4190 domain-containing protein n=1 Tax=Mycobacterium sp. 1274761.0 TaxID=1834077 RepID=UPI0007FDE793|nr:DUF4190 domain-containing protein [Mycobacterium sp. 1274761.0]OBK71589.1 DUF4190 domain-containing protein [Mycobacterium sp. 1274761.0]
MTEPQQPQPPHYPQYPQYPPPQPPGGAYPGSYPPPPPQPYSGYTPPPVAPKNGLGLASLVVAIVALISVFGGVVLGIVAVILGILGWQRARRGEATNGGIAIAGIVLGVLSIIEAVVVIALSVWAFNEVGGSDYMDCLSRAGSDQEAVQRCADQFQDRVENQFSVTLTTPAAPTR